MLNETNDGLGEAIVINEDLFVDETAVLEPTQIEYFENKQYLSEVDEVRINETADIMAEVFSEDVIASWSELSLDEKAEKLNEYYTKAGDKLGINTKGVIVEPMNTEPGDTLLGYNSGDGYIHLNSFVLDDPSMLGKVLETATHEMRHQFQHDVVVNPSQFQDISNDTIEKWIYEQNNYISPEYDYQGYYEQDIEADARNYAENVVKSFMNKMNLK
ncbi:MAG: hypothetical protein MR936_05190 [Eubacterium sp.]|nr:hypothetical protein [Eubacterium sp.]